MKNKIDPNDSLRSLFKDSLTKLMSIATRDQVIVFYITRFECIGFKIIKNINITKQNDKQS